MGAMIVKEIRQLIRDRKEMLVLLLMPVVLISILGAALGGQFNPGEGTLTVRMALVDQGDRQQQWEHFRMEADQVDLDPAFSGLLEELGQELSLPDLFQDTLTGPDWGETFEITQVATEEQAHMLLQNGEVHGYWLFPEDYRLATWRQMFLRSDQSVPDLELVLGRDTGLRGRIASGITAGFLDQMNLGKELTYALGETLFTSERADLQQVMTRMEELGADVIGPGVDGQDERLNTITAFEYYAVGMAAMFALYTAIFIAHGSYREKRDHVFDRLLLAGISPVSYMSSKMIAGTILSMVQVLILFGFSRMVHGVHFPDPLSFAAVTLGLCLAVGSLATLLISLSFRRNSPELIGLFDGGVVTVMAFLGGSFIPVQNTSDALWVLGGWLPNGAALRGYLSILRGAEASVTLSTLIPSLLTTTAVLMLAIMIFPRRSETT